MDLLNENQNKYQNRQMPKGKKVILLMLILSIIAAAIIIIMMMYLSSRIVEEDKLEINGAQVEITQGLIISDSQGNQYISLKDLAGLVNYEYYSNAYPLEGEDTSKCYIKNNKLITSFEMDTNQIYKYEEDTKLDYQYYNLNYNIVMYSNKLYIALADLRQSLNMLVTKDANNVIRIQTTEYLASKYSEELKTKGYTLAEDQNNRKALCYGWLVVSKNNVRSVLNTNLEEIIGSKYSTIYFDEKNLNYIVSNTNGRYGIISNTGSIIQNLKYDNLEILNYEHMLYKAKNNNKYGIVKEDGTMLTEIVYDEIGHPAEPANKIQYTLIIPELDGKSGETIVVKQNNKYGLVYLSTGEEFVHCNEIDKLYSINELGDIYYKIEISKIVFDLSDYIEYINTNVINLN